MNLRYRSPDRVIDDAVWHVIVREHSGHVATFYRWRKSPKDRWQDSTKWPGRLPKGLRGFFWNHRGQIRVAHGGVTYPTPRAQRRAAA